MDLFNWISLTTAAQIFTLFESRNKESIIFVLFLQFGEHLYIALSGEGKDTEEFLQRKLLVFNRLVTFYYGPVVEQ